MEGTCDSRHIRFDLTFSDNIQMVYADMGKIQQVLYNLIDNAIKFSHDDSVIYIQASSKYEKIFISVKDTGIGIPRDSIKKSGTASTRLTFPEAKTNVAPVWDFLL